MVIHSAWLLDTGQSRQDTRVSPLGTFTPTGALATRSGVVPGSPDGQFRITGFTVTGTGPLTANVSPGRAVIQGPDSQGAYPVALTEYVDITFDGGGAQDRVDLVVLHVYDQSFDTTGRTDAAIEVIKGTSPNTPPPTPALALPLYQVTVPAGASAGNSGILWDTKALVGLRTATVAVGGILPVTSDTAPGAYPGQYRDINGHLERWDFTTGWQQYPPVPVWQNWTPKWTTSTGNATPTFGDATLNCRYIQNGPIVHLSVDIVFGPGTKFGAGGLSDNWRFTLPVDAINTPQGIGFCELQGTGVQQAVARMRCTSTKFFELEVAGTMATTVSPPSGIADAITPWSWAANYSIRGSATYEVAP